MKKLIQLMMVMVALAVVMPSFAQEKEEKNLDKMKIKIQKLNNQMAEAAVKGDKEAGMAFYAEDVVYMPNYRKMIRGLDAMKKAQAEMEGPEPNITAMTLTTLDVFKSGSSIFEIGTFTITIEVPGAPDPMNDYGKYLTVWEKTEAGMKIKVEIWNTDMNPWGMMKEKKQEKDGGVEKAPQSSKSQTGATVTKSGTQPVNPNSEQNTDKKK